MWGHLHHLGRKIRKRSKQDLCERCGLLYSKDLAECPHCTGIPDPQLRALLRQRRRFRLGLGRTMMLAAIVIAVGLYVMNLLD